MRLFDVLQGSEQWEQLRRGRPTASKFREIVTPARGQLATGWKSYAAELLAQHFQVYVEPPPSFWMDHGTENEPYAIAAYESIKGIKTRQVGFVLPDDHDRWGCSPDRLVGDDGLLETKCPKPETLIAYHVEGVFPVEYKPQVQGQLMITGREWCDFMAYHPELAPFLIRVERDEDYIAKMQEALEEFCDRLDELKERLAGIDQPVFVQLTDDYKPRNYEASDIAL